MTPTERRTSGALASIYALRMLGLFLVLPVFVLQAHTYPGGDDPFLVGLAMGVYGLTQALLQVPFGIASDRLGRKPVIQAGLALFVVGSLIAAWAPSMVWLVIGRALQGSGAISAAVTALLADLTRDEVRTKSMAMVGGSIALMFALSLVFSPALAGWVGLAGPYDFLPIVNPDVKPVFNRPGVEDPAPADSQPLRHVSAAAASPPDRRFWSRVPVPSVRLPCWPHAPPEPRPSSYPNRTRTAAASSPRSPAGALIPTPRMPSCPTLNARPSASTWPSSVPA